MEYDPKYWLPLGGLFYRKNRYNIEYSTNLNSDSSNSESQELNEEV